MCRDLRRDWVMAGCSFPLVSWPFCSLSLALCSLVKTPSYFTVPRFQLDLQCPPLSGPCILPFFSTTLCASHSFLLPGLGTYCYIALWFLSKKCSLQGHLMLVSVTLLSTFLCCFMWSSQLIVVGIIFPISQIRKPRFRDVKWLAQVTWLKHSQAELRHLGHTQSHPSLAIPLQGIGHKMTSIRD